MRGTRIGQAATVLCWLLAAATLWAVLLSLGGGLETEDESTNLFMLTHPLVPSQFIDHQLWGPVGQWFGGTALIYRLMPLVVTAAAGAVLTFAVLGWLRRAGGGGVLMPLFMASAAVGVVGVESIMRPTMNYAITAFVCGDAIAGLVLIDWLRAPRRASLGIAGAIGLLLVPLFMARAIAGAMVGVAALIGLAVAPRREGARWPALLVVVAAFAAAMAVAAWLGVAFGREVAISGLMTRSYQSGDFLWGELKTFAVVGGAGLAGAAGILAGARLLGARAASWLAAASILVVTAAVVWDQRAVIGSAAGAHVNLYGTSYGAYALLVEFAALAIWGWWRERAGGRVLAAMLVVAVAAWLPFAGTMSGMIPKSAMNAVAIDLAALLACWCCIAGAPRLAAAVLPVLAVALAGVVALFTVLNTLWSPYGAERWTLQTVALPGPPALRGLRVTPQQARLEADLRATLEARGFDPARDRVMAGYRQGVMLLLADQPIVGHPFIMTGYQGPRTHEYTCEGAAATMTPAVRRVFGLGVDSDRPAALEPFSPALRACLKGLGIDFDRGERIRVSPDLFVTIATVRR